VAFAAFLGKHRPPTFGCLLVPTPRVLQLRRALAQPHALRPRDPDVAAGSVPDDQLQRSPVSTAGHDPRVAAADVRTARPTLGLAARARLIGGVRRCCCTTLLARRAHAPVDPLAASALDRQLGDPVAPAVVPSGRTFAAPGGSPPVDRTDGGRRFGLAHRGVSVSGHAKAPGSDEPGATGGGWDEWSGLIGRHRRGPATSPRSSGLLCVDHVRCPVQRLVVQVHAAGLEVSALDPGADRGRLHDGCLRCLCGGPQCAVEVDLDVPQSGRLPGLHWVRASAGVRPRFVLGMDDVDRPVERTPPFIQTCRGEMPTAGPFTNCSWLHPNGLGGLRRVPQGDSETSDDKRHGHSPGNAKAPDREPDRGLRGRDVS
jgi:hypothetical protein